jgi:hypothetical protein
VRFVGNADTTLPTNIFRGKLSYRLNCKPMRSEIGTSIRKMKRANAYEEQRRMQDRVDLVIVASINAAVRLARDEISHPSARLAQVIADSVGLAKIIPDKISR